MNNDTIPYYVAQAQDTLAQETGIANFIQSENDLLFLKSETVKRSEVGTTISKTPVDLRRDFHYGDPLPFSLGQTDGVFLLFVICLLFFAKISTNGVSFFKENIKMFFSLSEDFRSFKQNTTTEKWNTFFFILQFVVLVSIGIYDVLWERSGVKNYSETPPFYSIVLFILLILIFISFKSALLKFIGYIFDIQSTTDALRRTGIIGVQFLGILFFIPTLLLIYSQYWHIAAIGLMILAFFLVQFVLFYKVIAFFVTKKFNFLYLITYLCSVEILPCVFLAAGIFYLYRIDVFSVL